MFKFWFDKYTIPVWVEVSAAITFAVLFASLITYNI